MLIFDLKTIIFPLDDAEVSEFHNEYLVSYILSNICKKNMKGGYDNYEIQCVEQLYRAEKKAQIAFLSDQPFMEQISSG